VTLYSVFERSSDPAPAVIPETFSWFAALLPPVFALVHGLWLALLTYIIVLVTLGVAALYLGGEAGMWLYILLALLIGFEAPGFRRAKLRSQGWVWRADLVAAAEDLAQTAWLSRKPTTTMPSEVSPV
jgi:hypothetical protein